MNKNVKSILLAFAVGISVTSVASAEVVNAVEPSAKVAVVNGELTHSRYRVDCYDLYTRCIAGDPNACDEYINNWCRI